MVTATLQLFRLLLDRHPVGLAPEAVERGEAAYAAALASQSRSDSGIEKSLIEYGLAAWPYFQAQEEFRNRYGQDRERVLLYELLPVDLREKWRHFEAKGGSLHDYRHGNIVEQFFSPEEDVQIENALVEAGLRVRDYCRELALGEKQAEYEERVKIYQAEETAIQELIAQLRGLCDESGKWSAEIADEALALERGFAELEERPTLRRAQEKIEYYRSHLQTFSASSD
ncbi:MAG: hypothetical protein UY92_C0004G0079 [Candidatus Magasanikbacteria bacterium GW2011_GWA2_56_11]|uniref:Uncharacterized protein n=1 Tax=Candidatus Magasanikbacteria bacterium GW2011_GWA2_56_11 TaxID=1619044 RepID=A0A0G1YH41_9BACT|nr:MAG: hypothetical protein UY92_C0004G0079 [Candidatus Magasanikbacteria bacterium GW2011_GWA2_56_11]